MELGELCKKTLSIFGCESVSELGGKLYGAVMNGEIVKLTAFCDTVGDLMNELENVYLAELRDVLLPDLMSGKIDVSKIE